VVKTGTPLLAILFSSHFIASYANSGEDLLEDKWAKE